MDERPNRVRHMSASRVPYVTGLVGSNKDLPDMVKRWRGDPDSKPPRDQGVWARRATNHGTYWEATAIETLGRAFSIFGLSDVFTIERNRETFIRPADRGAHGWTWASATPDGFLLKARAPKEPRDRAGVIEIKCPYSNLAAGVRRDFVHPNWFLQVQHQLYVTGAPYGLLAIWRRGGFPAMTSFNCSLQLYHIRPSQWYVSSMVPFLRDFTSQFLSRPPPRPEDSPPAPLLQSSEDASAPGVLPLPLWPAAFDVKKHVEQTLPLRRELLHPDDARFLSPDIASKCVTEVPTPFNALPPEGVVRAISCLRREL